MPIRNYSVLKGKPLSGQVVTGKGTHYQITVQAAGGPFTVAVNIQSFDGSEVLYKIAPNFTPPSAAGLAALPDGMTALKSLPGGLALDFVREQVAGKPMITLAEMTLLPHQVGTHAAHHEATNSRARALGNAVVQLIEQAIAAGDSTLYAFGSAFADSGRVDGIHDIHMNQGNPAAGGHAGDNGIWQDGAVFLDMPAPSPAQAGWTAIFIAFQSESWKTDNHGNPL